MENGGISQGTEFRNTKGEIMNINYAKIAEGYGAKAYQVHSIEELKQAIVDAKNQMQSTLIEINVLPKTMTALVTMVVGGMSVLLKYQKNQRFKKHTKLKRKTCNC